jgi:hypothetical protein
MQHPFLSMAAEQRDVQEPNPPQASGGKRHPEMKRKLPTFARAEM